MDQTKPQPAPFGVLTLAILEYIAAAFFLIAGILYFFGRGSIIAAGHPLAGIILILLGIIHLILGSGLWDGAHWAYIWVVVISILYIVGGVIALATIGYANYVSLIVNIIVLVYLLASSRAKAYLA